MVIVKAIFSNFLAFLMSFILTVLPSAPLRAPVIETLGSDCLLNIEVLSDTHIESKSPLRKAMLRGGLKNISKAKSPVDAVIVTGDITNYADEPSLAVFYDILNKNATVPVIPVAGNHDIGHAGDRDVTDISREEALANFIGYRNEYMGRNDSVNYFSTEINGFKFIILGDEVIDGGHWDGISMSAEQLDFLDSELADGTKGGKPVFVFCHWPIKGINGESTIYPDSGIDPDEYDVKGIMEKYRNVYYISGHMHAGIRAKTAADMFSLCCAEQVNGVTYINLPTYGLVNMFGLPCPGIGAQIEVYKNEVVFRPRNFITNKWITSAEYHFDLLPH